jgi:phosphoesterase RecJ-like protein
MSETIKKFAPIILEEINKANNILLHCHPSPDPDSVGSTLATKIVLERMGKKVTLIKGDSDIPKAFDFPGVETITQKSYGEINPNEFDLFIALDASSRDQVSFRKEPIFPETMKVIVIDHHTSNKMYGSINCVDTSYPATALMIYDLFKEIGIKFNHDIALNLFMGIYADTGGFRYRNTNSSAFEAAAELTRIAPDFVATIFTMENSNNKESIIFEGLALSSVKNFYDNKLAISSVSYEELKKNNIKTEDILTGTISNKLKSVIGTEFSVTMIEIEPKLIKVSFRPRDMQKNDASKIAVALDERGHMGAAGARLNMTIPEAIDKVVTTVKEIYNL